MDLLLSARVIGAEEARVMGLVTRVVPPDELMPAALAYARDLAAHCSPASMASIKTQVYADLEGSLHGATRRAVDLMVEVNRRLCVGCAV